jgi:hypothetical protein
MLDNKTWSYQVTDVTRTTNLMGLNKGKCVLKEDGLLKRPREGLSLETLLKLKVMKLMLIIIIIIIVVNLPEVMV